MGWGQRNARFYCEVDSAREHKEKILGDTGSGIDITVACEWGALKIHVYAKGDTNAPNTNGFSIWFTPWRKSEKSGDVQLMRGTLNFDAMAEGEVQMKLDDELLEALSLLRAKELMVKGTKAEGL